MTDLPDPPRHRLTREFLLDAGFAKLIRRALPGALILDDEERRASLHAVLATREEHDGVWLFAYGSLIWNPTFHFSGRVAGRIEGWHRAFCLAARGGRGTPENPAMLLGLMERGECAGAAFRIAEAVLEHELDLVWRREMVTAAYVPRWVALTDSGGHPLGKAITFTINPEAPTYAGELPEEEIVRRIATARGPMGTCAEYLFSTRAGLHSLGIADPLIDTIAAKVEALAKG
jgi:glutathione-specific gamma-glutamylcyclotransferase